MENIGNNRSDLNDVPGEINYMPQRTREQTQHEGKVALNEVSQQNKAEKNSETIRKAKAVLMGVAVAALVAGGLILAGDGEEHRPMNQEDWQAAMERSSTYGAMDLGYGEDSSTVEFSFGGAHYFLEDLGNDGNFEKGRVVANQGASSAEFEFSDFGLPLKGAKTELDSRMR